MAMSTSSWFTEKILLGKTPNEYLRSLITPVNFIAVLFLIPMAIAMVYRIFWGLGPSTNLSDSYPWGLWIGLDIMIGIALAAPGLTLGTAVHLFGMKDYHHFVRPAILSSMLGYIFGVTALLFDLGRYYRLLFLIGWSWGFTSVLFLIGWHFAVYTNICIIEWSPALFEWLNLRKYREISMKLAIWATIFGVMIAGGHQSALGGLLLIAPSKLHPLWYSSFLPVFFLLSALVAGICMVIIESAITHRVFRHQLKNFSQADFDRRTVGLGMAVAPCLFVYLLMKIFDLGHEESWVYLNSFYGFWYLFEIVGFVVVPIMLFTSGARNRDAGRVRVAAVVAILGVVLNRLNVSIFAFNWRIPASMKYYPKWSELALSAGVITLLVLTYRFIANRMAIMYDHPDYEAGH